MNAIQHLLSALQTELPELKATLDAPENVDGRYFLDLSLHGHEVVVEWKEQEGFGISASVLDPLYGEGPEEAVASVNDALARIVTLLRKKQHTHPPAGVLLREIRERLGLSQTAVADRLGVRQSWVSKIENRQDMQIGTLARFLRALGGELELFFHLGDEQHRIAQFDDAGFRTIASAYREISMDPVQGFLRAVSPYKSSPDDVIVLVAPPHQTRLADAPIGTAVEVSVQEMQFPGFPGYDMSKKYAELDAGGFRLKINKHVPGAEGTIEIRGNRLDTDSE